MSHVPILDREEGKAFRPQTLTIVYASPTIHMRQQVKAAAAFIALVSLLLLGATAWLALVGIRRGLSPLQALAQQAAQVSTHSWQLQPPKEAEEIEELRPLTESMTQMLARLERSFVQQREFLGNAAHELKTPVAVLKSTYSPCYSVLEVRKNIAPVCRPRCRTWTGWSNFCNGCCGWPGRAVGARCAAPRTRRDRYQSTCGEAVERIRSLAQSRNTAIHLATDGPVPFRADPEDLQLAWMNLLENAVRYSPRARRLRSRSRMMTRVQRSFSRTMARALPPLICPISSNASIAETPLEPGHWRFWPRLAIAKALERPTEAISPPRAFRVKAPA